MGGGSVKGLVFVPSCGICCKEGLSERRAEMVEWRTA